MPRDLNTLLEGLASPDPEIRDGWAARELADGIAEGRFDADLPAILQVATARLQDPAPWTRSFAVLLLMWLAARGTFSHESFAAAAKWYVAEQDTRGYDAARGWIHAVAHGADYFGLIARNGLVPAPDVLAVLGARLVGPGGPWTDHEDARIARSAVLCLSRCRGHHDATGWLHQIDAKLTTEAMPGPVPSWVHNTSATCALLHVALSAGTRGAVPDQVRRITQQRLERIVLRIQPYLIDAPAR